MYFYGVNNTMINNASLVGRLGQDPEIRYFDSGSVKARFSLAVDRLGSKENKQTDWFTIEAWGKLAEFAGEWLKKGTMVSVQGDIEINSWQDQTGNTRETPLIRASEIRFVGSKRDNQQGQQGNTFNNDAVVPF
jgi:single-strand DNA-binding protein